MARGIKTRFLEDAIENGIDSAVAKFPQAFEADKVATWTKLAEPQRKQRLQEMFQRQQEIDDAFDD